MKGIKKRVLEYNVVFQQEKDGGYSAWVPDLPGCASQGETLEETIQNIKEAICLYVEDASNQSELIRDRADYVKQFVLPIVVHA